jgi:hypothetical protein
MLGVHMGLLNKYCQLAYDTSASCLFIKNHRLFRLSLILSLPLIALYFVYMRVPTFDSYGKQYEVIRYQQECLENHGIDLTHISNVETACKQSTGIYSDLREECIVKIITVEMGATILDKYKKCKEHGRLMDYANRKLDHSMTMIQYYAGSVLAVLCFIISVCHLLPLLYKCLKRMYMWVVSGND